MNINEIKEMLPHREDMLLIEEAHAQDGVAHGTYRVRGDEFFLRGHFPGNPVVPGVILCEIMAQTCSVLLGETIKGATPYFTGLNGVKFRNKVVPGDILRAACTIKKSRGNFFFAEGKLFAGEKLCASGEFSFVVVRE